MASYSPLWKHCGEAWARGLSTMKHRSVDGDYAYILWSAETADNVYDLGSDTFVVRNGQIVAHSFALKIRAKD